MKKKKKKLRLKTCMLCRLCIHEWLPAIAANKVNYEFKKGETIFREGDEMQGIYFVYEGKVKVHKHWDEEKELIIRFAKKATYLVTGALGTTLFFLFLPLHLRILLYALSAVSFSIAQ